MTLFYLVDTSGSMGGSRIGTVNAAMEECIPLLKEVAAANDDAEIKVAILQFSSGSSWVTPASGPVGLDDIIWNDLQAGGMTEFGGALLELDKKLSRNEYLNSQTGAYAPVILLLSDGGPTDNWEVGLNKIKENNWFKHAIKIAIDIESGSDRSVLAQFTGNPEAILDAKDTATLKKMIHKVSVRASEFQSHSKASSDTVTSPDQDSADIVSAVVKDVDEDNGASVSADDNDWGNWD
ncbi:MAG: VWA domain-containing protein [Blautia sp.]|nr:VWA domain-containing protein [Blautia sp.]